jgi:hypothetical protein
VVCAVNEPLRPAAPTALALALERWCLHSGGNYYTLSANALADPRMLDHVATSVSRGTAARHTLTIGQLATSIDLLPAPVTLARPLWPPLGAFVLPVTVRPCRPRCSPTSGGGARRAAARIENWAPTLAVVGLVPLAHVHTLHVVWAGAVCPVPRPLPTDADGDGRALAPLCTLLHYHLQRHTEAAIVVLRPIDRFGYIAAADSGALVLAALAPHDTATWAARLAGDPPAATIADPPPALLRLARCLDGRARMDMASKRQGGYAD